MKLPKVYEAKTYEQAIYKLWEDSGAFQPRDKGDAFSIVLPPPNATGKLHVGHAAMLAIEDTIVRYRRMQGDSVAWIPGTDHAAIATNAIIERQLTEEGTTKHDIGREAFLERLHQFVGDSQDSIRTQMRAMGASLDWTRERYTMEPAMNRIVGEVFKKMYDDGLIYRGHRIINWDKVLQTTVSDDEIEHKSETTKFYTFTYGPFEIGTSRPETKFGDKYVVMHPEDDRYAQYSHGQEIEVEWIKGPITATIIKDEAVNPEFGTGAMTITPWHDVADFEIAERHNLDKAQVIDLEGKLLPIAGEDFVGLPIEEAREKVVEALRKKGLLVSVDENYQHNIAVSDRGKAIIEPQIMEQWFIDVNKAVIPWKNKKQSLKQIMQSVVREGDIEILPERFDKTYFNWIDNLRDWCISRQIWWGHRIPAWYKLNDAGGHDIKVGFEQPEGEGWNQDPDTLDTWFSAALWSWSTLIEPEIALDEENSLADMLKKSPDYKKFHPNNLMETGYDIIFFWVARMILMTTYVTEEIPFKTVYLHGLVRTKDGSKMSKSKPEDSIDPLDVIPKYGTDALRLALIVGQTPGNDVRIYEDKIASYRNFCNKLWNIARYVEDKVGNDYSQTKLTPQSTADHWILARLTETTQIIEKHMAEYELGKAHDALYQFIWNDYADWYIEVSKVSYNQSVLVYVLEQILHLAHPFAPFVTETIWDTLDWQSSLLISSKWPNITVGDTKKSNDFDDLKTIIGEVRAIESQLRTKNNVLYFTDGEFLESNKQLLIKMTRLKDVKRVSSGKGLNLTKTTHICWLDVDKNKMHQYMDELLVKQTDISKVVANLEGRISNKSYVSNAPKEIVTETKQSLADQKALLERVSHEIDQFKNSITTE